MKQITLSTSNFDRYGKTTRRAVFLAEMDQVVPWATLCALVEPYYPKAGNGRPPVGLERMLRIYFLQNWFNLSDPAVEESLYDSLSMRDSSVSTLAGKVHPMKPQCASSATCWKITNWVNASSRKSVDICKPRD